MQPFFPPEEPFMSTIPPRSPGPVAPTPAATGDSPSTLEMAQAQRGMMWLFLAKLGIDFSASIVAELPAGPAFFVYCLAFAAVDLAIAYYVFRLTNLTHGTGPALVSAGCTLTPGIGTFTVLILNGNTIDRLRKAGLKVGFMGATKSQLEELAQATDHH
jgi:hypothetical protein